MAKKITPDILLVLAPPWGIHEPHLGIAYIVTYLKRQGYYAEILDLNIDIYNRLPSEFQKLWSSAAQPEWMNLKKFSEKTLPKFQNFINAAVDNIIENGAQIIGFSVTSSNRLFTLVMIKMLKEKAPSITVVVGGIGCYTHQERLIFLPEGIVDVFVVGEGEKTIEGILAAKKLNIGFKEIEGTISWDGEKYSSFSPRPLISELDTIPFPTFDEFPLDAYYYGRKSLKEFTMKHGPLITSRGCINNCAFCNDTNLWPKYRHRSAQDVCNELLYEVKKRNITAFVFQDLALNGDMAFLIEMCRLFKEVLIDKFRFPVRWISNVFVRKQMTYEVFKLMREAGAHTLMFGIESGSDKVLNLMKKGYDSPLASRVLSDCKKAGISVWINIIIGFPGETDTELEETLRFLRDNKNNIDKIQNLNTCNVVDNADLSSKPEKYGITLPDDDMAYLYWHSTDQTNNFEIRKNRLLQVAELARELCIPVENMNIQGEENKLR